MRFQIITFAFSCFVASQMAFARSSSAESQIRSPLGVISIRSPPAVKQKFYAPWCAHGAKECISEVSGGSQFLTFNGRPVQPRVEGNAALSFAYHLSSGSRLAALIEDDGGSACPALFRWIVVSAGGYKLSPEFGTCTDLIKAEAKGGRFIVRMPGFVGPFNTQAEQQQAVKRRVTYVYDGNTLIKHEQSAK